MQKKLSFLNITIKKVSIVERELIDPSNDNETKGKEQEDKDKGKNTDKNDRANHCKSYRGNIFQKVFVTERGTTNPPKVKEGKDAEEQEDRDTKNDKDGETYNNNKKKCISLKTYNLIQKICQSISTGKFFI